MRYLPFALIVTASLTLATSCAPVPMTSPAQGASSFQVQAKPGTCCKVTGGGFIEYVVVVDPKVTFGFNATRYDDVTSGEVEVVDHGTGYNFHGSTITSLECYSRNGTVFYLFAGELAPQSTGYPGTFQVAISDSGEPGNTNSGKGSDTFDFYVTGGALSGYTRGGTLAGGNIQAHVY